MLGAFLLGFADGTINTNLIAMIGNLYNPKNIQNIKIDKNDNFWKCLIFISGLCYPGERESAGAFVLWNLVQVNNIFYVLTTSQFHTEPCFNTRTTLFQHHSVQHTFEFNTPFSLTHIVSGVELTVFRCWTEGCVELTGVLNWCWPDGCVDMRVFHVELTDFEDWTGVGFLCWTDVLNWEGCGTEGYPLYWVHVVEPIWVKPIEH